MVAGRVSLGPKHPLVVRWVAARRLAEHPEWTTSASPMAPLQADKVEAYWAGDTGMNADGPGADTAMTRSSRIPGWDRGLPTASRSSPSCSSSLVVACLPRTVPVEVRSAGLGEEDLSGFYGADHPVIPGCGCWLTRLSKSCFAAAGFQRNTSR